eukprot:UN33664
MLVSTLVLSFSFGFIVEGTFPGQPYELDEYPFWALAIYVTCMGLSIVVPFWSIWMALLCKNNLDKYLQHVLVSVPEEKLDLKRWIRHYMSYEEYWVYNCQFYYEAAYYCFWLGLILCLAVCAVLTAVNFACWYDDQIYIIFLIILLTNMALASVILLYRASKSLY